MQARGSLIRRIELALSEFTVHEMRSGGSNNNGGGFVWFPLRTSAYKFSPSGAGTDEYYVELAAGGDPGLTEAKDVYLDGWFNQAINGTGGSLNAEEWDWGDWDARGWNTVQVRLADGADPDTKGYNFVGMGKGGGVDYTRQTASQLSLTDLTTDVAGTTLSSVTGGFTALMVGNLIYIRSGTGFVVGWYEITAFTDTNNVTIDRSAGSSASAGAGEVGGARALWLDAHFENGIVDGNYLFMQSGTFTLTSNMNVANDGSADKYIKVHGYKDDRGDAPTGTDRPLIAGAAFLLSFDDYWEFKHMRITTTHASGLGLDNGAVLENMYANNSSVSGAREAMTINAALGNTLISCEAESVNGTAVLMGGDVNVVDCIFHDSSVTGLITTSDGVSIINSIIYNCGIGISADGRGVTIAHNTIDNCTGGISATTAFSQAIMYNSISNCTTGIDWVNKREGMAMDWNNYYNNTTDISVNNLKKGNNSIALDPEYVGGGNFKTGDNMVITREYPDVTNESSFKIGAIQTEEAGGGETSFGCVT
jgi:hypothetical protein